MTREGPAAGTPAPPALRAELRAALWMIGAIVSFSFMAVAGRWLSEGFDTFEIMLYRSLTGMVIVLGVAGALGTLGEVTARSAPVQILRNLFHFAGQNLWFFAITIIPLAQVFALEFTSPLWVLILSPLLLGERMTPPRIFAAILGFIGILLVARPGATDINAGVIAGALAAIGFAVTMILTKRLTRTETLTCILVYLTVTQAIFGLICAGWDGDIALPDAQSAPLLALAEALDPWVFAGAALIFAGNYYNIWTETRKAQDPE